MIRTIDTGRAGFHLDSVLDPGGWKTLHLDSATDLIEVPLCPADGTRLRTLCTFTSRTSDVRIRVAACPECGHISYVDRPTPAWFEQFYRDVWDKAADTAARRASGRKAAPAMERAAVQLATSLALDRRRPVCEIGCGHGTSLQQLQRASFERLVGIEASSHRADIARRAGDFEILTSPFEAEATQAHLRKSGPFALIFSIHALEHMFQPDLVVAAASSLQGRGDRLILSVPHQTGEPTVGVLMFLPHLHSFTRTSLVALGARNGYRPVDEHLSTPDELNIVFEKSDDAVPQPRREGAFDASLNKVVRGLALDRPRPNPARLWWLKKRDVAGYVGVDDEESWQRLEHLYPGESRRALRVSDLVSRVTTETESALEIQSEPGVTLFYK